MPPHPGDTRHHKQGCLPRQGTHKAFPGVWPVEQTGRTALPSLCLTGKELLRTKDTGVGVSSCISLPYLWLPAGISAPHPREEPSPARQPAHSLKAQQRGRGSRG